MSGINPVTQTDPSSAAQLTATLPGSTRITSAQGQASLDPSSLTLRPQIEPSPGKASFLTRAGKSPSLFLAPQSLTKAEMRTVAASYRESHGIQLFVDGDGTRLSAAQNEARAARLHRLESSHRYLHVASDVYESMPEDQQRAAYGAFRDFFENIAPDRLDPDSFNMAKLHEFNQLIDRNASYATLFNKCIEDCRRALDREISEIGLQPEDVVEDLMQIRQEVGNQSIGYIYTGHGAQDRHADSFIITPGGTVLNPLPYRELSLMAILRSLRERGVPIATADPGRLTSRIVHPQAGRSECGALSLVYMKEYLKCDEAQLREHVLIIDLEEHSGVSFMLPSPQVLRYSQSSAFIDCVKTFVDTELVNIAKGRPNAVRNRDGELFDAARVDAFRHAWVNTLTTPLLRRDTMWIQGVNTYLAEVVDRHHAKAARAAARSPAS